MTPEPSDFTALDDFEVLQPDDVFQAHWGSTVVLRGESPEAYAERREWERWLMSIWPGLLAFADRPRGRAFRLRDPGGAR